MIEEPKNKKRIIKDNHEDKDLMALEYPKPPKLVLTTQFDRP